MPTTNATLQTLKLDGILYVVDMVSTPDGEHAAGRFSSEKAMRDNGQAETLFLRRPQGVRSFIATKFVSGVYSRVSPLF